MEWKHKLKQRLLIAYSENDTIYWQFKNIPLNTNNVFFSIDEKYVCEYMEKYGCSLTEFEDTIINIPYHGFRNIYGEVLILRNEPYKHCCVRRVDLCYGYKRNIVFVEYVNKNNSNAYDISGAEKVLPLTYDIISDLIYFANFRKSLLYKSKN